MLILKHIPLVRYLLPFTLGIIIAIYQETSSYYFVIVFIFFLIAYIIGVINRFIKVNYKRNYYWQEFILYGTLFFSGIMIVMYHSHYNYDNYYKNYDYNSVHTVLKVISPIKIRDKTVQFEAEAKEIMSSKIRAKTQGKVLVSLEKDSSSINLLPSDEIIVNTDWNDIKEANNPEQFNYKQFLKFHQITQQAYVSSLDWKLLDRYNYNLLNIATKCRNQILNTYRSSQLDKQELAVISAITLGYKDELSNELIHSYSSAGAMHVLAVSGLHVGIIYLIFNSIISLIFTKRKIIITVIMLIIIWFYATLTGLSPSIARATTMISFILIGRALNRSSNIYNTLAASAFFLLMINPYNIMQVGFQLSFLAVLGILFFQPLIYKKFIFKNIILDKIWAISSVAFAAQIATFPLGLLYFHQFPTYFFISNLIVIPAATITIFLSIILLLSSFCDILFVFFGSILNNFTYWLNYSIVSIDSLPFSLIEGISINVIETFCIYSFIILLSTGLIYKTIKYINYSAIIIICLLTFDLYEDHFQRDTKKMIIYSIKDNLAVDFIYGNNHVFLYNNSLIQNKSKMQFNIYNSWHKLDLKDAIYKDFSSNDCLNIIENNDTILEIKNNNISFYGHNIFIADKFSTNKIKNKKQDMILLLQNYNYDLSKSIDTNTKVLSLFNLSYKQKEKIDYLITNKDNFYSVYKNGAFVLNCE